MQVDAAPDNVNAVVDSVENAAVDPVENVIPVGSENGQNKIPVVEEVVIQQASVFDRFEVALAPEFAAQSPVPVPLPKVKSIVIKEPTWAPESSTAVKRKLFTKVLCFLTNVPSYRPYSRLHTCDIDPDLPIPYFFKDLSTLAHLICMMPPQITDPNAEGIVMKMLGDGGQETAEGDDDLDLVEIPRPADFTPRKKRAKKLMEQVDDQFLRCSKRVTSKTDAYKYKASSEVVSPEPLAMIPPSKSPAPHLSKEIVEGIATGFLKIHPTDVSDALIQMDSNDDEE